MTSKTTYTNKINIAETDFVYNLKIHPAWFSLQSSGESSFLGSFGAVHYNHQRCTDFGDQVPARNHMAIHPCLLTLLLPLLKPFFHNHIDDVSASLHMLPMRLLLSSQTIPSALNALHINCPTNPMPPTSTGNNQTLRLLFSHSASRF